jgi:predicted AAA+ superfamily ATPase
MKLIDRKTDRANLAKLMSLFPVTAILGPRQCGKTTLARSLKADAYFDLENPQDVARLEHPQLALEDLALERLWVVYPGKAAYRLAEKVQVIPLADTGDTWNYE